MLYTYKKEKCDCDEQIKDIFIIKKLIDVVPKLSRTVGGFITGLIDHKRPRDYAKRKI